jgi:hypothetical protein
MIDFTVEAYQNEYLPIGGSSVHAIVTVTAEGSEAEDRTPGDAAEIIIIDTSGSMSGGKIRSARAATIAAIECLPDGAPFAVIGGCDDAYAVYPEVGLAIASREQRQAAAKSVGRLRARGGTAISTWLECAGRIFDQTVASRRHAILLTDGRNESEDPAQLAEQLQRCEGQFQCDCRGVGTDWVVDELRLIASRLLGSLDIIADPAGMAEDFRSMMESSMAREIGEVALRVWTPEGANVAFFKQVAPVIEELTQCCPRGSTARSRTTRVKPSWPRRSATASRRALRAMTTPRRSSWDEPRRSHTSRPTTTRFGCYRRSSTSTIHRPERSGFGRPSSQRRR